MPTLSGHTPPPRAEPSRQDIRSGGFVRSREAVLRKAVFVIFGVCVWITLLAAVVTTVVRLGTEAKERRTKSVAAHFSETKR